MDNRDETPIPDTAMAEALRSIAAHMNPANNATAMKRALRPENTRHPGISALNPRGDKDYPRPKLKYKRVNVPYRSEPEDFDRERIELLNLLEQGQYMVDRNDGTQVQISVKIVRNDLTQEPEELWFISPFAYSSENRLLMPSMTSMMRAMIGEKADSVMTMAEERKLVASGELSVSVGE